MRGVRVQLLGIAVVLFGGFVLVGDTIAFVDDGGYWVMILGIAVAALGLVVPSENDAGDS